MTSATTDSRRDFDVVVFGASGFTGRLVAEYLHDRYPSGSGVRWAIAGRDRGKLEQVLTGLGGDPQNTPIVVADSADRGSLDALTSRTRVVLTTVGPYARYGSELVASCVAHGTSYCDLAGEVQWMRRMIDEHESQARETGARIVHSCGFDSIPSDIGVWFLQQESVDRFGRNCRKVKLGVRAMRGGASGGTVASMLNAIEEGKRDREVRRVLAHPYGLNPADSRDGPDGRDQTGAEYCDLLDTWTCPFVMGMVNTRIVRRSNALLNFDYGRDFEYSEATMTGRGPAGWTKAALAASAFTAFMAASAIDVTRNYVVKPLMPDPGEGPDEKARETGFFKLIIVGVTSADERLRVEVTGDRDPGYGSTSKMIAESAVCLAHDELPVGGGFWTPASAMGAKLIRRLRANAGVQFEIA